MTALEAERSTRMEIINGIRLLNERLERNRRARNKLLAENEELEMEVENSKKLIRKLSADLAASIDAQVRQEEKLRACRGGAGER